MRRRAAAAGIDLSTFIQSRTVDIPLRRRTTPEEVAEGMVWLATPSASYVTANRLNISGGLEWIDIHDGIDDEWPILVRQTYQFSVDIAAH